MERLDLERLDLVRLDLVRRRFLPPDIDWSIKDEAALTMSPILPQEGGSIRILPLIIYYTVR